MCMRQLESSDARILVRHLHPLVTCGPWEIDIAWAMSPHGYDEVKWAEGQAMLAELVSNSAPPRAILTAASCWYQEAAATARRVLAGQPYLLTKLGLEGDSA
jgi:hypothetical protein